MSTPKKTADLWFTGAIELWAKDYDKHPRRNCNETSGDMMTGTGNQGLGRRWTVWIENMSRKHEGLYICTLGWPSNFKTPSIGEGLPWPSAETGKDFFNAYCSTKSHRANTHTKKHGNWKVNPVENTRNFPRMCQALGLMLRNTYQKEGERARLDLVERRTRWEDIKRTLIKEHVCVCVHICIYITYTCAYIYIYTYSHKHTQQIY